jgi:ribosome-binding protein aMBF1 (putative translation factor)
MIKNGKQYKITNKKLKELEELIAQTPAASDGKNELYISSLLRQKKAFKDEIKAYEKIKNSGSPSFNTKALANLPDFLIEYKIASGFSQKEFAAMLGIKEQQLQRYEAEDYRTVSFSTFLKFIAIAGLDVQVSANMRKSKTGEVTV